MIRIRRVCVCGHQRHWHEHHRPGTDCAGLWPMLDGSGHHRCVCDAWRWRGRLTWTRR